MKFIIILISFILLISLFSDNKEHFKQKCIRITPLPKGSIIKPTKSNFITDRIGQDYHYPNYITPPGHFGVSSKGNISTLFKNINASVQYGKYLNISPVLGNNYFINAGKCGKSSSPECKGKDKWIYVRNIPTGKIPCINLPTPFKGLIPGVMESATDLDPAKLLKSMAGKGSGSTKCYSRTELVGPSTCMKKQTKCSVPDTKPFCFGF
tara:strand:- start:416 stop:1042 length:627 start_codon:yes stop_codon:yes gene_type:complete